MGDRNAAAADDDEDDNDGLRHVYRDVMESRDKRAAATISMSNRSLHNRRNHKI